MQHVLCPVPQGDENSAKNYAIEEEEEDEDKEKRDRSYCNSFRLPCVGRTSFALVVVGSVVAPGVVSLKSNQPRLNAQPKTQTQLPTWTATSASLSQTCCQLQAWHGKRRQRRRRSWRCRRLRILLGTRPTQTKLREILQRIFIWSQQLSLAFV